MEPESLDASPAPPADSHPAGEPGPTSEPLARRLHPATLLFDVGRRFVSMAFYAVAVLWFAASRQQAWYLFFLVPPIVNALVRYVSFRYTMTGDHLVLREGLISRNVRHVPYARVQNIDTLQGPFHRLLGVVEVRLETAAGKEPEAVFQVISSAQLAELRAHVFGARPGAPAVPAGPAADPAFFRMRSADVLLFGLFSQRGLVYLGGAFVLVRELADFFDAEARVSQGLETLERESATLSTWIWVAAALALFLCLQLATVAWAWLTLHGFRLARVGEDLRTTCGLLTRQSASLPRGRVQVLEVREGWLARQLGRCSIRVASAGADSTGSGQVARKWLVPLCARTELERVLAEVQPEARLAELEWVALPARARRRLFVRGLLAWGLLAALVAALAWPLGLLAAPLALVAAWVLAGVRHRRLAFALTAEAIFLRDGLLARRILCVRYGKVQSVALGRSPLDRRARMARLRLDTAGVSKDGLHFVLPMLDLRQALRLVRRIRAEAAQAEFRWG
jgi:putative membrane protein